MDLAALKPEDHPAPGYGKAAQIVDSSINNNCIYRLHKLGNFHYWFLNNKFLHFSDKIGFCICQRLIDKPH